MSELGIDEVTAAMLFAFVLVAIVNFAAGKFD
jgi:hypothetical protein